MLDDVGRSTGLEPPLAHPPCALTPTWRPPQYKGYPIDYCLQYETSHYGPNNSLVSHRGDGCGEPVADKFCQILGYAGSEFNTGMYVSV